MQFLKSMLVAAVFLSIVISAAPWHEHITGIKRSMPRRAHTLMSRWPRIRYSSEEDPTIRPTAYGADPTGVADSTAAFLQVVQVALARNTSGHHLAYGIHDLGGVTIDLGGGDYLINEPIVFPGYVGNFRIIFGTLRAGASFPRDRWIIEIGTAYCNTGQQECNQDIGFEGLFLDGNQIAAGCVRLMHVMHVNFGPQMYLLNFTQSGIQLDGGHNTMIHESWFGEYMFDAPQYSVKSQNTATAILIDSPDHYVTNTVVFSGLIGMHVKQGGASLYTGVHTWNLQRQDGGIGILVSARSGRFTGCYLDGTDIIFQDTEGQSFVSGFFLNGGHIVFQPQSNNQTFSGVYIAGNTFMHAGNGNDLTITVDSSSGSFGPIVDFEVVGSASNSYTYRSPQATQQVWSAQPITKWVADFTDWLVFDTKLSPIQSIRYSFVLNGTSVFPRVVAQPADGGVVTVLTDISVSGTMTITVDQSAHPRIH